MEALESCAVLHTKVDTDNTADRITNKPLAAVKLKVEDFYVFCHTLLLQRNINNSVKLRLFVLM